MADVLPFFQGAAFDDDATQVMGKAFDRAKADPARGRQVVRGEPMSTLDAELNDFGAQLAMLRGHAADRDG
jgi:hypothetical protein